MGVSENEGYHIVGVLIIRILLFRVLYYRVSYSRKLPEPRIGAGCRVHTIGASMVNTIPKDSLHALSQNLIPYSDL